MKRAWVSAILALGLALPTAVTARPDIASMLLPTPISVVLAVGRWIVVPGAPKVYYIQVQGRADTQGAARDEAFRRAVEEAIGSVVLTESVVINDELRRREIINYSSGYVDRFKVVREYHDGRHFVAELDVWVRHSHIADRLLSREKNTTRIDPVRLQAQTASLRYEREQGTRALGAILADYPRHAFTVTAPDIDVYFDANRTAQGELEFEIGMDPGYLRALWEGLQAVSTANYAGHCRHNCGSGFPVSMEGRHDRMFFNRWAWTFLFTDRQQISLLQNTFQSRAPAVRLQILDAASRPLFAQCYAWPELDGIVRHQYPDRQFVMNRRDLIYIDSSFRLRVRAAVPGLDSYPGAAIVDLSVVAQGECPNF